MTIFYLISIILGVAFQNVAQKPYTQKTKGKGQYFFSLLVSVSAMVFFFLTSKNFAWNSGILLYAAMFGLAYGTATVFQLYAITYGSLSLTSLIIAYSLVLPTVYGLVFLKDPFSAKFGIGVVLLVVSIFLINRKNDTTPITMKWAICAFLAFVGNGMASVTQKMQQVAFGGAYKNEFMILALAFVTVLLGIFVLKQERREIKHYAKCGGILAVACGLVNGMVNLFVMILSGMMPVSVMFPMISAGGIIITYIISRFFYKEKLTKMQFIGFLAGIASVIFLS